MSPRPDGLVRDRAGDLVPEPAPAPPRPARGAQRTEHGCVAGWLGEDEQGRPVACEVCRPHVAEHRREREQRQAAPGPPDLRAAIAAARDQDATDDPPHQPRSTP